MSKGVGILTALNLGGFASRFLDSSEKRPYCFAHSLYRGIRIFGFRQSEKYILTTVMVNPGWLAL